MLLELFVRLLIEMLLITGLLLLCGCDSGSAPMGQVSPEDQGGAHKEMRPDLQLKSADGVTANLSYAFSGMPAPGAIFADAGGQDVNLSDFSGAPVLVNIWATWCAPCKAEMPLLDALSRQSAGKMAVIAISQDLAGREGVDAFFADAGIKDLVPYIDSDNEILAAFGGNISLPTTILYDSASKEIWRVTGGVDWGDAEVAELIMQAG